MQKAGFAYKMSLGEGLLHRLERLLGATHEAKDLEAS